MPDDTLRRLLSALDEAPLMINTDALTERLATEVEALSQDSLEDILWALLSVYSLREEFDLTTSEAAGHITQAVRESASEDLGLTDEDQFEERLVALLSSGKLDLIGKASALTLEQEHFMREARIVTDIRPIFGSDPANHPNGAVLVHTLRITYIDDSNQRRDFYVAMDAADVSNLQGSLKRAEQKAGSLKSMLEAAEVPFIDLD